MKRCLLLLVLTVVAGAMFGQDVTPTPMPGRKRGWLSRILHPFSPNVVPQYKDPRLRGLALDLQIGISFPQPIDFMKIDSGVVTIVIGESDIL